MRYYKFHHEIPRIFNLVFDRIFHFFYNSLRRIEYNRIKKLLSEDNEEEKLTKQKALKINNYNVNNNNNKIIIKENDKILDNIDFDIYCKNSFSN